MKLTIDRERWMRGQASRLLCGGRMCCLGFFARACGLPDSTIDALGEPQEPLQAGNFYGPIREHYFKVVNVTDDDAEDEDGNPIMSFGMSSLAEALIGENDDPMLGEPEREEKIAMLFAKAGVDVDYRRYGIGCPTLCGSHGGKMKELSFAPGEHIERACLRLVAEAPAWVEFNGVRIESQPGDAAGDLQARWSAEMDRKAAEYHASDLYKQREAEAAERAVSEKAIRAETTRKVAASGVRERFPWAGTMGEISGFGGGYEAACRDMVYAGLAWLEEKPRDLSTHTTEDAKALDKEILAACPDCSGAMHGAAMNAVAFIAKHGWPEYERRMTKRTAEDAQGEKGPVTP